MRMKNLVLAALFAAFAAPPALAAEEAAKAAPSGEPVARPGDDACLQNSRLWSWQAVDSRTLRITDRTNKRFTVRVASGCVGLTNVIPEIEIRGLSSLSCVRRGDFVRFVEPNLGRLSCTIVSVERIPDNPRPGAERGN